MLFEIDSWLNMYNHIHIHIAKPLCPVLFVFQCNKLSKVELIILSRYNFIISIWFCRVTINYAFGEYHSINIKILNANEMNFAFFNLINKNIKSF